MRKKERTYGVVSIAPLFTPSDFFRCYTVVFQLFSVFSKGYSWAVKGKKAVGVLEFLIINFYFLCAAF